MLTTFAVHSATKSVLELLLKYVALPCRFSCASRTLVEPMRIFISAWQTYLHGLMDSGSCSQKNSFRSSEFLDASRMLFEIHPEFPRRLIEDLLQRPSLVVPANIS